MWYRLHKKQEQIRNRLKSAWFYRVFGDHLFQKHLWIHDVRAVAGGLALGLFIALTPTIPFQMFLAVLGALYFRFNLPIALAACWVTNPLTLAPIYLTCWKFGRYILEEVFIVEDLFDLLGHQGRMNSIVKQSAYLWTGSLILAAIVSLLAYLLVWLIWVCLCQRSYLRRIVKRRFRR